jgi:aminopeptidase N
VSPVKKVYRFQPTPRMSTYLVAFVVSDLECVQANSSSSLPSSSSSSTTSREGGEVVVFVCSVAEGVRKGHVAYGGEVAVRALRHFSDLFGIPFPLPKIHLVAIPDFAAGAMV